MCCGIIIIFLEFWAFSSYAQLNLAPSFPTLSWVKLWGLDSNPSVCGGRSVNIFQLSMHAYTNYWRLLAEPSSGTCWPCGNWVMPSHVMVLKAWQLKAWQPPMWLVDPTRKTILETSEKLEKFLMFLHLEQAFLYGIKQWGCEKPKRQQLP